VGKTALACHGKKDKLRKVREDGGVGIRIHVKDIKTSRGRGKGKTEKRLGEERKRRGIVLHVGPGRGPRSAAKGKDSRPS